MTLDQKHKNYILDCLKKGGYRLTGQRRLIVDALVECNCSCCKEIYYRVSRQDPTIGLSTVYRLLNLLEEMGAIGRNAPYELPHESCYMDEDGETFFCNRDGIPVILPSRTEKKIRSILTEEHLIEEGDIFTIHRIPSASNQ